MSVHPDTPPTSAPSWLDRLMRFCLENKLVVILLTAFVILWGAQVAPFDWNPSWLPRNPVPTDAIPDIGENQQIVFTEWMGRSPQDVEDQVSYPLTVSLLGVPGVKTVRSYSFFGFSSIYVIFKDGVDFYWSRSRLLEKLNSLPAGTLPEGVKPMLGPDATALGQVFWYTLEGRDEQGQPAGGWDLAELRSTQDWYVRYALLAADGVSEVASVGGFVREYQIDVDPDAMRAYGVSLNDVFQAVRMANIDVGARSIEVNQVEYFIRGLGFIEEIEDINRTVVKVNDNVPVFIKDVARVSLGPALRRGALDKGGAEAVGGVVVVRYGANPLEAIKNVKSKIKEISAGLPEKAWIDWTRTSRQEVESFARSHGFEAFALNSATPMTQAGSEIDATALNQEAWLSWMKENSPERRPPWIKYSKITVVPFYDRTGLIYETLGTLDTAIFQEILVTIIVVLVMVRHLGSSILISGLLPLAVLMTFIAMRLFGVDANIVALSGIAIAIGTMVDMGIVICENILRRLEGKTDAAESSLETIFQATREVGGAVLTAVLTTVVGFLPVFAMTGAEGKLFKPLAFTKTFALVASIIVALTLIPPFAHMLLVRRVRPGWWRITSSAGWMLLGVVLFWVTPWWAALLPIALGLYKLLEHRIPERIVAMGKASITWVLVALVTILLAQDWLPLGPGKGLVRNVILVAGLIGGLLLLIQVFQRLYPSMLRWTLDHKATFLVLPACLLVLGGSIWLGFDRIFYWLPNAVRTFTPVSWVAHKFPGLGKEFMPPLDEGSYLFMPTTMPHASIGEAMDVLQKQDMALQSIPEIEQVVGKLGRVDSSLDPAPISMFETLINYKPEYLSDPHGRPLRFRFDGTKPDLFRDEFGLPLSAPDGQPYRIRGTFERDSHGRLIPDDRGNPFRLWRPAVDPELNPSREAWSGIQEPDDIWEQILQATEIPGTTSAPKLQPIATRLVMLQSGMRAPMGVKVKGPDLNTIEKVALDIEALLKQVPSVEPNTVVADRIVGKPYLEIDIDREAIARHGIHIRQIQEVIEVAIGGKQLTSTVEGRERYPVRVRYLRELRDQIESLDRILVPASNGAQIPLVQLAEIRYVRGPQSIKSEDTFLVGYVIFDMKPGRAEVDVVEDCDRYLQEKIASGELSLPKGVSITFAGSYENQVRATKKLTVVVPLALFVIFLILYLNFRSTITALMVFTGILTAWAGGFLMIWLYAQPWFLDFPIFEINLRDLFQIDAINLSVAVWVGFLALFGIASDNGVLFATILNQEFEADPPRSSQAVRDRTVQAALRRVRPALMTSATTILALLPVLSSTGRGSDIMVPMAIPSFGGMAVALITMFVVPVLYCAFEELRLRVTPQELDPVEPSSESRE